jgi:hypothetical protein
MTGGLGCRSKPEAHTVSAVVLVNGCTHLGKENTTLAELAINQLIDGCGSYAGPKARFTAILLPSGAIAFESRADQSKAIPICVLNHPLTHRVRLPKACTLDVQLQGATTELP